MAASLDQAHVEKKFKGVTTTQDSIQSISMWVMHHKSQHEKIVDIWFGVLKKSKLDHRLTLFYLCNDIVQMCRKKHAVMYKDAFKEVLKDATLFVRDGTVRPAIERIFKIWSERGIYDEEFTEELVAIINNTKVRSTVNSKLLAEFQPLMLMEKVITLKRFEDEIELKRRQLVSLRLDASSVEAVRQLKDRTHGGEFCAEFESACTKMEDYVKSLEKEMADRASLIEMLEQSELYYDAQYGEAKIVANAYKNFGGRVSTLQKKLGEKMLSLPDTVSPMPSPPLYDAPSPSPENSPEAADGSGGELLDLMDSPIPPGVTTPEYPGYNIDTQQVVDMEMSDDENEHQARPQGRGRYRRQESTHVTPAYPDPISSVTDIHLLQTMDAEEHPVSLSPRSDEEDVAGPQGSPLVVDREDEKAAYIPSVAKGASLSFLDMVTAVSNSDRNGTKESDGGSTPVMDEFESDSSSSKKKDSSSKEERKAAKQRPIDFLAQLISQSKGSGGNSSSSTFFKNLSVLTDSVKTKIDSEEKPALEINNTADQWAAWKALQGPPPQLSPPPGQMTGPPQPLPPPTPPASVPQMPPPPRIHPSLMPMPTPPFAAPLPPPPVLPMQEGGAYPQPPPPSVDSSYPQPPPPQGYNRPPPPQNTNFAPPLPPGQQEIRFPPPPQGQGNGYRPQPPPLPEHQTYPPQQRGPSYASPAVSTSTTPSYSPIPQNANYPGQTTPPTPSYGVPQQPPLTPTSPDTARFPCRNENTYPQQRPRMYPPPMPPGFQQSPSGGNANNYAAPRPFTPQHQPQQSPFIAPPQTPPTPVQQPSGVPPLPPRFPGPDETPPPSQQQGSWGSSGDQPSSPNVHFPLPISHRSNLTTIQTVDDPELHASSLMNSSTVTIPTLGQGGGGPLRLNMETNNVAQDEPPSPKTLHRFGSGGRGDDGQMEFIEKLKMKSGSGQAPPNHSSNLRTLTEVPMELSENVVHHHRNHSEQHRPQHNKRIGLGENLVNISQGERDLNKLDEEELEHQSEPEEERDLGADNNEENDEEADEDASSMSVANILQKIRDEATTEPSSEDLEDGPPPQLSPEPEFDTDRNHQHLTPRYPLSLLPHVRPPNRDEPHYGFNFGGLRPRPPRGGGVSSPRQPFSGPRSPFGGRPPPRHFGPRPFGFQNKRHPLGMPGGRPYFPRPRY